jgi:hypothetical protein
MVLSRGDTGALQRTLDATCMISGAKTFVLFGLPAMIPSNGEHWTAQFSAIVSEPMRGSTPLTPQSDLQAAPMVTGFVLRLSSFDQTPI